jgi:chorismate mutase/prephenate dehydrogenase
MTACAGVLEELAAMGVNGVVAEMCSLKGHLLRLMEQLRSDGLRLVSFHPLFGPDVRMLSGRTIIFCKEGRNPDLDVVRGLFAETSAKLVDLSVEEHDRRMGLVLGLTHLANLVFARAMTHSSVDASELADVAGVTFTKQLATTREVAAENPGLYFEIQALNQLTPDTGRWLHQALDEWLAVVAADDESAFSALMRECHCYLDTANNNGNDS